MGSRGVRGDSKHLRMILAGGLALSRFSRSEIHRFVVERVVCEAPASTIGRWLAEDAIQPWQVKSWLFPRDPELREKAGRVLDLCTPAPGTASRSPLI